MRDCNDCGKELTKLNTPAWRLKRRSYVCTDCSRIHYKKVYLQQRVVRLEREREKRRANKRIVVDAYGGKCSCCGEKHIEFLTIAHKNNDGAKHRREIGGGKRMAEWVIKNNFPDDLTVECFNCNAASFYYGQCPHKKSLLARMLLEK